MSVDAQKTTSAAFSPRGRVRPNSVSDIAVLVLFLEHHN